MAFIGCGDTSSGGDSTGDITPPAQSVTINNLTAASESISFAVANPNAEAVQVTVALTPTPPDAARIAVDGGEPSALAGANIDLTKTGADGASKNIRITGLDNGTEYMVTLTTADTNGHSRKETVTGSATPLAPPDAATLTAAAGDGSVILSWAGGGTASGYRVYRVAGDGEFVLLTTDPATLPTGTITYTDTSAANGTAYRYRLRAVNVNGEEVDSNTASATPLAPPNAPALTVVPGDSSVVLTWRAPTGGGAVSGYRVYRRADTANSEFTLLATNPATLTAATRTYTDASIAGGTDYRYRLRAVNANGAESGDSNVAPDLFHLHSNGVTVLCPFAANEATGTISSVTYTKRTAAQIKTLAVAAAAMTNVAARNTADMNVARSCTSGITDMTSLFRDNTTFNTAINHWDTRRVTTMNSMFLSAEKFNQNIGSWNVAAVMDMGNMFRVAGKFNNDSSPDIGSWDVAAVTNMSAMFRGASDFNQNIGSWNVAAVGNMDGMFQDAAAFNQNIGSWTVTAVTSMSGMFNGATNFNQNIGNWTVTAVTNMNSMFNGATNFNHNIGNWTVTAVTNMNSMFNGATNFNQNLSEWRPLCITSKPSNFDTGTATGFVGVANRQPTWPASRHSSCP